MALPAVPGEGEALRLILKDAEAAVGDGWAGLDDPVLPGHPGDFDWDLVAEDVFEDARLLNLFDPDPDGTEDPGGELNPPGESGTTARRHGS